jgi:hypothetical protein
MVIIHVRLNCRAAVEGAQALVGVTFRDIGGALSIQGTLSACWSMAPWAVSSWMDFTRQIGNAANVAAANCLKHFLFV